MTEAFKSTNTILKFARVLMPNEAEAPILSADIRAAIFQWMIEMNAQEELREVGLRPRRTAMFSGPPGCGKTTLAHHLSARIGIPLVLVDMHRVVSKWVGESASNIGKLFDEIIAQENSCILFLDEFDSVATSRIEDGQGSSKERNNIVVSLLQTIDSYQGIMIAATNRGADIDPAIWRRFGMHLEILPPDDEARFAIIQMYLSPFSMPEESIEIINRIVAGASPALIRNLMEGIKRDLILSPRHKRDIDVVSVFNRISTQCKPHESGDMPFLWSRKDWSFEQLKELQWPPVREEKKAA